MLISPLESFHLESLFSGGKASQSSEELAALQVMTGPERGNVTQLHRVETGCGRWGKPLLGTRGGRCYRSWSRNGHQPRQAAHPLYLGSSFEAPHANTGGLRFQSSRSSSLELSAHMGLERAAIPAPHTCASWSASLGSKVTKRLQEKQSTTHLSTCSLVTRCIGGLGTFRSRPLLMRQN